MNIAHTKTRAVDAAGLSGLALVRRVALCCVLATAGISVSHAGPGDKDREDRAAQAQRDRQQAQRQYDSRVFEARADEQRRQAQQDQNAQNNADNRQRRMTADERRDLRRQINEVGADLYSKPPRR